MENNWKYRVPETVVFARVCDVPVLAVTRDQFEETDVAACILNETGEVIWHQIERDGSLETIVSQVAEYYGESEDTVRAEVMVFLETLESHRIIRKDDLKGL